MNNPVPALGNAVLAQVCPAPAVIASGCVFGVACCPEHDFGTPSFVADIHHLDGTEGSEEAGHVMRPRRPLGEVNADHAGVMSLSYLCAVRNGHDAVVQNWCHF